jgi:hypothetical protein
MAFKLKKGKTKTMMLEVTPSTAITAGALVAWASGQLVAATSSSSPSIIAGVLVKTIAAADDDYADERLVAVEVPMETFTVWEADVTSGLVSADKGLYQDLTDSLNVNRAASTLDVVQCVRVLSTTKGEFLLNIGPKGIVA